MGKTLMAAPRRNLRVAEGCILANPKELTPLIVRGKLLGLEGPWPSAAIKTDDFPAYLDESNRLDPIKATDRQKEG